MNQWLQHTFQQEVEHGLLGGWVRVALLVGVFGGLVGGSAGAQDTTIKLLYPSPNYYTTAGTVKLPFRIQGAADVRQYRTEPLLVNLFGDLAELANHAGYRDGCGIKDLYWVQGKSVSELRGMQQTWMSALQGNPARYRLLEYQAGDTLASSDGQQIQVDFHFMKNPAYQNKLIIFAFLTDTRSKHTWVLLCESNAY